MNFHPLETKPKISQGGVPAFSSAFTILGLETRVLLPPKFFLSVLSEIPKTLAWEGLLIEMLGEPLTAKLEGGCRKDFSVALPISPPPPPMFQGVQFGHSGPVFPFPFLAW